jgi:hypothetical protein
MKQFFLPILVSGALIAGCATETAQPPVATSATVDHQGHAKAAVPADAQQAHCADGAIAPSMSCSDTVTATFDGNGTLWVAWVQRDRIYVQSSHD